MINFIPAASTGLLKPVLNFLHTLHELPRFGVIIFTGDLLLVVMILMVMGLSSVVWRLRSSKGKKKTPP